MKKVFVVYEYIPENTAFFSLSVSESELEKLRLCHGYYINNDMPTASEEACDWLSSFLEDKEPISLTDGPFNIVGHDLLIHTGFLM